MLTSLGSARCRSLHYSSLTPNPETLAGRGPCQETGLREAVAASPGGCRPLGLANLYSEVTMAWLRQDRVPGCQFRRGDSSCLYPCHTAASRKTLVLVPPSTGACSGASYLLFMIRMCGSSSCFKPGRRPQAGPPPSLSPSLAEKLGVRSFFRARAGGRATVLLSASRPRFWVGGGGS